MQNVHAMPAQSLQQMDAPKAEELTIHVPTTNVHPNPMSEARKEQIRETAPSLTSLLIQTLERKDSQALSNANWICNDEVEIKGLSSLDLHSFILRAEELGKNVTFTKTLTVKISD